jgi:hypothetical protein
MSGTGVFSVFHKNISISEGGGVWGIDTHRFTNDAVRDDATGLALWVVDLCLERLTLRRSMERDHLEEMYQKVLLRNLGMNA